MLCILWAACPISPHFPSLPPGPPPLSTIPKPLDWARPPTQPRPRPLAGPRLPGKAQVLFALPPPQPQHRTQTWASESLREWAGSVDTSSVACPCRAYSAANEAARLVLPTPPFPLTMTYLRADVDMSSPNGILLWDATASPARIVLARQAMSAACASRPACPFCSPHCTPCNDVVGSHARRTPCHQAGWCHILVPAPAVSHRVAPPKPPPSHPPPQLAG